MQIFGRIVSQLFEEKAKNFYTKMLIVYSLAYFANIGTIIVPEYKIPCSYLQLGVLVALHVNEGFQAKHEGFKKYIQASDNIVDNTVLGLQIVLTILNQKGIGEKDQWMIEFMQFLKFALMLVKLMYLVRVNEKFNTIVLLLKKTYKDTIFFGIYFFFFVLQLSVIYRIFTAVDVPGSTDYAGLNDSFVFFFSTFRNSIGDINTPELNDLSTRNLIIVWFIWTFNIYHMLIISLNFLIAVISQSYEEQQGRQVKDKYIQQCQMTEEACIFVEEKNNMFGQEVVRSNHFEFVTVTLDELE